MSRFLLTEDENDFKQEQILTQDSAPVAGADFTEPEFEILSNQCSENLEEQNRPTLHFILKGPFSTLKTVLWL